jgi:hypothetical protein
MTQSNSLFLHGFKLLRNLAGLFAILATTLYAFECLRAKQFPATLTTDKIIEYSILGTWIAGLAGMLWIFLMVMEILKRRNFDLATLHDNESTEPLRLWILKQAITVVAIAVILLGSTLIFVPAGLLSLEEYFDIFRSHWVALIAALAVVFSINILAEVIKRQWQKFKAR